MAETPPVAEQQAATLDVLTSYRPTWLSFRKRVERAANLDASLNNEYRVVNDHMDFLLERYFSLTGGVQLEPLVTAPEAIEREKELAWQEYDGA